MNYILYLSNRLTDPDLGNAVHAIVDVPGQNITEVQLLDHLAERLVRYMIPRSVEFVDEPLRDDAGKVRRKTLREERINNPYFTFLDSSESNDATQPEKNRRLINDR